MKPLDLPPNVFVGHAGARGYGLFARRVFVPGQTIFVFGGRVVSTPFASPRAMQIGFGHALESDRAFEDLLNHSCRPNCRVVGRPDAHPALVAVGYVSPGQELTYDYDTTEADLEAQACAFDCRCGSFGCRGRVRGWDHLDAEQRAAIAWRALPHLTGAKH